MAELKTKLTDVNPLDFINTIEDENRRKDALAVLQIMKETVGAEPKMWGDAIVGFGTYHYKYASGREADWLSVGFSPRKSNLTLYLAAGFPGYDDLKAKLSKGKLGGGKGCIYVKKLSDIDVNVLKEMIVASVAHLKQLYP